MMGMLPSITPPFKEFSYLQSSLDTVDRSTYTFSSIDLGVPSSGRLIIVAIGANCGGTSQTITGVTIGGISATIDIQRVNSGNSQNGNATIASAIVPTGTSGDIVVTLTGAIMDCAISAYRAARLNSTSVYDTAPDSDIDSQYNMTVDVPSNGIVVATSCKITGGDSTWTGVDENYDDGSVHSHASRGSLPAATGYAVSVNAASDPSRYACASYG